MLCADRSEIVTGWRAASCCRCTVTRPTDAVQRFDEFRPGLDHVGFGCADRGELERLQGRVEELGIEHGGIAEDAVGYALSFRDPDGVALEFWASRS